jgi:Mn2+/Fe2+ NRAMP family transporter
LIYETKSFVSVIFNCTFETISVKYGKEINISSKLKRFWKLLGPGLITGASDDDPSGIATYSQAGAAFGLSTLWTGLLAFPLMAAIQQMCAKIGLVTSLGLTGTLKKTLSKASFVFDVII